MATGVIGPGLGNSQISLQQAQESQLLRQMQSAAGPDQAAKIHKGAMEFEALLLSNWLQQAEQSLATVPGGGEDEDEGAQDTMTSLGVQSLAGSLAASGGIGIGAMVEKAMLAMAQKSNPAAAHPAGEIHPKIGRFALNSALSTADRMLEAGKGPK